MAMRRHGRPNAAHSRSAPGLTLARIDIKLSVTSWLRETFKRLYWSGSKARFVGMTWYGNQGQTSGVTPNYHINVQNAQTASAALAATVNGLGAPVYVAGHSLGNMVVSTAISDHGAAFTGYFMLNAAVAVESYDGSQEVDAMWHDQWSNHTYQDQQQGPYDSRLLCSNWYQLFPSGDARSTLTWRDRLSNTGGTAYYNFFSSGENVLANHSGTVPSVTESLLTEMVTALGQTLNGSPDENLGKYTWAYQEKLKGLSQWKILGSDYGGWEFNRADWGIDIDPAHHILFRERFPSETGIILADTSQMQTKPFFFKGVGEADQLFTSSGGSYAQQNRNRLLAEMVPALSNAAGANNVQKLNNDAGEVRNFDMSSSYENGWPTSRSSNHWLHSDLKTISYPYIYQFYDKLVELGGLKND